MPKLSGGCLCGKIQYEINGPIGPIFNCHCSQCRKWHGSAFRTRAAIKTKQFRWTKGEEFLGRYRSSPPLTKTFCKNCGSSLVSFYDNRPDSIGLPLGTLNEDPGKRVEGHIFVGSKASWYEITDDLPQWDTLPEDPEILWQLQKNKT